MQYSDRPREHEQIMITRWQKVVPWDATVLHLGDLFFGGDVGYERFRISVAPRLTGEKYLILGNHDKSGRDYEALGFTVIEPFSIKYRGWDVSFDHYPKFLDENEKQIHVHGHIHNSLYSHDEPTRHGNINVSVEVTDYRPHRITRLLNKEIRRRNRKQGYRNRPRGYKRKWVKNAS